MRRMYVFLIAVAFLAGCVAFIENKEGVSRIKTFGITDDEALDLLDKAESKSPDEKREIHFFRGQ